MDYSCQAPLSMEFPRQECWSGLPFPSPEDLPSPSIELGSLKSPALENRFFTTSTTWEALIELRLHNHDSMSSLLKVE